MPSTHIQIDTSNILIKADINTKNMCILFDKMILKTNEWFEWNILILNITQYFCSLYSILKDSKTIYITHWDSKLLLELYFNNVIFPIVWMKYSHFRYYLVFLFFVFKNVIFLIVWLFSATHSWCCLQRFFGSGKIINFE